MLDPAHVRRNDTSAASINEWTGEKLSKSDNVADDIQPDTIAPLGNYAVQILWQDGFNQVQSAQLYMWCCDNNNADISSILPVSCSRHAC